MTPRAAVLAGGAARRYNGVPKGLLAVGGRRILDRVVDALREATGAAPLLIANAPDAATWRPDLATRADARPGSGTLGGIFTAIGAGAGPVVCVAWDMPFVRAALLRALLARLDAGPFDAVLPASSGRRGVEPLCAVYGPACGPAIARRLDAGELQAISFHADVRVGILSVAEVAAVGGAPPEEQFFNVNTPEDLARAEELCRRHA
jgi:molybdopterin-guanine dinucleotide biosynthesis protein A